MKRITPVLVGMALALTLTASTGPAVADDTTPAPVVLKAPQVEVLNQRCMMMDDTHFYYAPGSVFVHVEQGVSVSVVDEAGQDVTSTSVRVSPGRYEVTATAPDGAVFESGSATAVVAETVAAAECVAPAVKVRRGAWHVRVTKHWVRVWRTVKTTRWHLDLDWDGNGGQWLGVTTSVREKVTVRR